MKKIGNRPITEADTDFFPYLLLEESYALGIAVSGQICLCIFILLLWYSNQYSYLTLPMFSCKNKRCSAFRLRLQYAQNARKLQKFW